MPHLRRTLFIGLGGMGIQTILKTKAAVMDNYSIDGEMPPMIAFLGIDTDSNEYTRTAQSSKYGEIHLAQREMMDIAVPHPHDFYEYNRKEMGWLPPQNEIFISSLDRDSNQIRSNGRLSFIYNCQYIKQKFRKLLMDVFALNVNNAILPLGGNGVDVHFVFSLCGGTGSGIFIDAAYLMREVAVESNIDVSINAYAVMPGVYMTVCKNPLERMQILPNAYAALRELDYVMSASYDRTIKLPWTKKEKDSEPFDSVTLIDNQNEGNIVFSKSEDLAEMISTALLTNLGQVGSVVLSISDNIHNDWIIRVYDVENKRAWVSALGVGALVFDAQRMARVFQLKAQNKLIDQALNHTQDIDVITNNWVDLVHIRENYGKDQLIDALYDMSVLSPIRLTTNHFDKKTVRADVNNIVNQYFESVRPTAEEWNSKVNEIYGRVRENLENKEKELAGRSIGLLADFLTELQCIIRDLFMKEMSDEHADFEQRKLSAKAEFDARVDELDHYMQQFFRSSSRVADYMHYVSNAATTCMEVEIEGQRRSYALQLYSNLLNYIDSRIQQVQRDKETLLAVRSDNEMEIRILQNGESRGRSSIIDLTETPIRRIEANEDEILAFEWVRMLPSHNLCNLEKEEVRTTLERYTSQLPQYMLCGELTIDDAINQMIEEEVDSLMHRMKDVSHAFLRMNNKGCRTHHGTPVGEEEVIYLGVPDARSCRLTKDGAYQRIYPNLNVDVVSTGLTDRIVVYLQKRPVPVFVVESLDEMKCYGDREMARRSPYIDENWLKAMDEECFSLLPNSLEYDKSLFAWVMGCVMGLVKYDTEAKTYSFFDPWRSGDLNDSWFDTKMHYRDQVYDLFRDEERLTDLYMEKFSEFLANMGVAAVRELEEDISENYIEKYSQNPMSMEEMSNLHPYDKTVKLLQKEMVVKDEIFDNF